MSDLEEMRQEELVRVYFDLLWMQRATAPDDPGGVGGGP